MGWLDREAIPLWHTTGNHTAYNAMSEAIFRGVLGHLPRNGPPGQEGLSYWIRRGDLLLVFANTLWTGLGGEGYVETNWLGDVLRRNADAPYKLSSAIIRFTRSMASPARISARWDRNARRGFGIRWLRVS